MDRSEWWQGELADDVYRVLREKELSLPRFCARSPQLHLRRHFVDLLATLSEQLQLGVATHHLAIPMLDVFMDRHNITVRCLYTCSICYLIIAAKFEEMGEQVPRLDWVNRLEVMTKQGLSLSKEELQQTEFLLLRTIDWNLCTPTAAHFVDHFLWLSRREDAPAGGSSYRHAYTIKYTAHFLQLALQGARRAVEERFVGTGLAALRPRIPEFPSIRGGGCKHSIGPYRSEAALCVDSVHATLHWPCLGDDPAMRGAADL
ncbi:cyclin-J-like isoform X2 [Petromyzon marinus]